jgi:hypothetical protein
VRTRGNRRRGPAAALAAVVLAAGALLGAAPADARDAERARVRVSARCGTTSTGVLVARGDGRWIRIRMDVRARGARARAARWRVSVLHERRRVRRTAVRARAGRLRVSARVQDLSGPDRIRIRAMSPWGEVCDATGLLVAEEGDDDRDDDRGPGSRSGRRS